MLQARSKWDGGLVGLNILLVSVLSKFLLRRLTLANTADHQSLSREPFGDNIAMFLFIVKYFEIILPKGAILSAISICNKRLSNLVLFKLKLISGTKKTEYYVINQLDGTNNPSSFSRHSFFKCSQTIAPFSTFH